ncbi:hypothetical protein B0A55_07740 [Friedmanniomyces simplex]|uniref:Uncharacterized protein n=1 Tax=Friedmanniomyces simplex TaxID=329884 RepID=A0A4U0XBC9_9PEZI|nr:hypothetical protein B0A55_07740 [Friedmanniomyces simplex]
MLLIQRAVAQTAKKIINKQTGFPSAAEWQEGFTAFATNFNRTVVLKRIAAFKKAGLQTDVEFEENMSELVLEYTGPGPWNVMPLLKIVKTKANY